MPESDNFLMAIRESPDSPYRKIKEAYLLRQEGLKQRDMDRQCASRSQQKEQASERMRDLKIDEMRRELERLSAFEREELARRKTEAACDVRKKGSQPVTGASDSREIVKFNESMLDDLVGLHAVKENIVTMSEFLMLQKRRGRNFNIPLHIAFTGNPGTGKTTVARIYGQMLHTLGIMPTNTFVECSRQDLIASYIGQTAPKTQEVINRAIGGVLFIDEAQSLVATCRTDFSGEALSVLNKAMEDRRGEFAVVFAGYADGIEKLVLQEPGLASRLNDPIHFSDYSIPELVEVFLIHQENAGFHMEGLPCDKIRKLGRAGGNNRAYDTLFGIIDAQRKRCTAIQFGNARGARKLAEKLQKFHAKIVLKINAPDLDLITIKTLFGFRDSLESSAENNADKSCPI